MFAFWHLSCKIAEKAPESINKSQKIHGLKSKTKIWAIVACAPPPGKHHHLKSHRKENKQKQIHVLLVPIVATKLGPGCNYFYDLSYSLLFVVLTTPSILKWVVFVLIFAFAWSIWSWKADPNADVRRESAFIQHTVLNSVTIFWTFSLFPGVSVMDTRVSAYRVRDRTWRRP